MENRMNGNAVRVWTKQHENVLRELETKGRYVARREYILADLGEHAPLVLEAYDWLVKHTPAAADRPADADYPIWVSLKSEATMLKSPGTVILELTLDPSRIVPVNIMKWGAILDYSYIPADQETLPGTESSWRNTGSATARHICPSSTRRSNGRS